VPQRIVSLAPSNTEFLFAIGLGDRVVGVTEYCNYPDAASRVERVAGFSTLSAEKIASVEPDLVLAARGNDLEGLEMVRKMGIPVFAIDVQSVDQLVEVVRRIGRITGADAAAGELADSLHGRIITVRQAISESKAERPKVFWGFWGEPIYTAGAGTIIDDVIHQAGGDNVGRSAPGSWPQIGLEALVALAPEVIITTSSPGGVDAMAGQIDRLRSFEGWKSLPAVKSGRVHFIEGDLLTRPGPRLIEALEQLALIFQQGSGPSAE
jgi:iron complex transport system substrate-binding protein